MNFPCNATVSSEDNLLVRLEVLKAASMKMTVPCDIAPCNLEVE
jgi:hypothetical protein